MAITLELDRERIFRAIDEERQRRGMNRGQAAAELGFTAPVYTYWSQMRGFTADGLLRACYWLNRNPMEFARCPAERSGEPP
jgi:hypothetical protein